MVTGQETEFAATKENTLVWFFKDYFALQIVIALHYMHYMHCITEYCKLTMGFIWRLRYQLLAEPRKACSVEEHMIYIWLPTAYLHTHTI